MCVCWSERGGRIKRDCRLLPACFFCDGVGNIYFIHNKSCVMAVPPWHSNRIANTNWNIQLIAALLDNLHQASKSFSVCFFIPRITVETGNSISPKLWQHNTQSGTWQCCFFYLKTKPEIFSKFTQTVHFSTASKTNGTFGYTRNAKLWIIIDTNLWDTRHQASYRVSCAVSYFMQNKGIMNSFKFSAMFSITYSCFFSQFLA